MNLEKEHPGTVVLARSAMFTALAVGSGYALLLVPNVELITAIIFVSGVYLGSKRGLMVGIVAEFIFSAANPLGSGLVFPPLLVSQISGMGFVGFAGGLLRKPLLSEGWPPGKLLFLGATGAILTLIYDTVTTIAYPLSAGFGVKQIAAYWVAGMGFTVIHQVSNTVVFVTALPRVFERIR